MGVGMPLGRCGCVASITSEPECPNRWFVHPRLSMVPQSIAQGRDLNEAFVQSPGSSCDPSTETPSKEIAWILGRQYSEGTL